MKNSRQVTSLLCTYLLFLQHLRSAFSRSGKCALLFLQTAAPEAAALVMQSIVTRTKRTTTKKKRHTILHIIFLYNPRGAYTFLYIPPLLPTRSPRVFHSCCASAIVHVGTSCRSISSALEQKRTSVKGWRMKNKVSIKIAEIRKFFFIAFFSFVIFNRCKTKTVLECKFSIESSILIELWKF